MRNKIVEGTLGIARYWASVYFRKTDNTISFDDLYQIACQALISAAHYYIPSERATFNTYARRCIENSLRKTIYKSKKMKKRRYKCQEFFVREKDFIQYVKMFIRASGSDYTDLVRFRKYLRRYNKTLRMLGEYKRLLPSFSLKDERLDGRLEIIINYIIKGLKECKIGLLITDEDRDLVNLLLNYQNKPQDRMYIYELSNYLDIFLEKLELVEEYLNIEEELQNNNDGITPTDEDILEEFNKKIKLINREKYKLKKEGFYEDEPEELEELFNHYWLYLDEYSVDPFISNDEYERGGYISKEKERDDILKMYIYDNNESEEEYLKRILKERNDYVNSLVNEANIEVFEQNKKIKEQIDKYNEGFKYKKYYRESDILEIKRIVELLYGEDDELMTLLKNGRSMNKSVDLSLEDEVLNKLFLDDYYRELEKLSEVQKEILLRYYDELGMRSMTAKQIGFDLGITPSKVYKEKDKALKLLQNSEVLQAYNVE